MKTLPELISTAEPAWPTIQQWLTQATNPVAVLPRDPAQADRELLALQVTTRSPLGAVVHSTGGLLADGGWLRVLGGGGERLTRGVASWNGMREGQLRRLPGACLVADDAVGGFFALNGDAFGPGPGIVHYFAPDTLSWHDTRLNYSQFLQWAFTGDLAAFYANHRWEGWREIARALSPDRCAFFYPPLCADGPAIAERYQGDVPVEETWAFQQELIRQLQDNAPAPL